MLSQSNVANEDNLPAQVSASLPLFLPPQPITDSFLSDEESNTYKEVFLELLKTAQAIKNIQIYSDICTLLIEINKVASSNPKLYTTILKDTHQLINPLIHKNMPDAALVTRYQDMAKNVSGSCPTSQKVGGIMLQLLGGVIIGAAIVGAILLASPYILYAVALGFLLFKHGENLSRNTGTAKAMKNVGNTVGFFQNSTAKNTPQNIQPSAKNIHSPNG